MLTEFFCDGSWKRRLWALSGLVVFLLHQVFKAYLAWAMNGWYERFYDLLQTHVEFGSGGVGDEAQSGSGMSGMSVELENSVYNALVEFSFLVAPAVVVHPVAGLVRNWWVFSWRRVLMRSYLHRWNTAIPAIEGASQRVHEDTARFASGIQSCVSVIIESIFTLGVFCPVLFELDPMLMTVAVIAALGGLAVSMVVGWPLVGLEVNNQRVEAELRKKMVLLEADPKDVHTNGTPYTPFIRLFGDLSRNYWRLYLSFAALSTWLSLYEQVAVILPYVLVAPRLFAVDPARRMTLGKLVKVSNSFGRVFDSLNVISDRWLQINEWRSCLRRLREFEAEVSTRSPARPARLVAVGMELGEATGVVDSETVNAIVEELPWAPVDRT